MINLIVEDGTGLSNSNSYLSVEEARSLIQTVHTSDDLAKWDALLPPDGYLPDDADDERKKLLIRVSSYFDQLLKWKSSILNSNQAMLFPRVGFTDSEGRVISGITSLIKKSIVSMLVADLNGEELTTSKVSLKSEKYGDATDTYSSSKVVYDSDAVQSVLSNLKYYGYGSSRTVMVILERA